MTYKLRIYTGPTQVNEYADRLEGAGFTVTERGTEHVHVTLEAEDLDQALGRAEWGLGFAPLVVGWSWA